MPLMQTSPSPCAACASPAEKSAPGFSTGRYNFAPPHSSRTSMLPPKGPAAACELTVFGWSDTHYPQNGRSGTIAGTSDRLTVGSSCQ